VGLGAAFDYCSPVIYPTTNVCRMFEKVQHMMKSDAAMNQSAQSADVDDQSTAFNCLPASVGQSVMSHDDGQ